MRKRIVGILICTLLITTTVPVVSSIDRNIEKNDNNELISNDIIVDDDCGCGKTNNNRYRFGRMKERSLPLHPDKTTAKPTVMTTPEYFNWMDFEGQDWTTTVKDQGDCGNCWDFAALGALDSVINIREGRADLDVDLSEQYVLSCLPRAGNCYDGGPYNVFYYIMNNKSSGNNCNGIIPESCFPYRAIDTDGYNGLDCDNEPVLCDEKCENWEDFLIPITDYGLWYPDGSPEDRDAIKSQIMQYGPVVTSMQTTSHIHGENNLVDWGLQNHNPDDYFSSSLQFNTIDHCVTIVGWKDDPSIDNGGYWICKNEWSPVWGLNGFFNIEYGCLRIDSAEIDWVVYNPDVIVNWEPVANAGGIYYGDVGQVIVFNASESFDHEGEIVSYLWDFGDGYYEYGMTVTHMYESQEVYPVKLTVGDNDGNFVNDTTWAFIGRTNDPPNTPIIDGPPNGKTGTEYIYNFSTVDPDGDDLYYFIYWGDGWAEWWIGPYGSGEILNLNHTWIDKATYTISVKVKDEYEFETNWTNQKIIMPKSKSYDLEYNLLSWLFERFPDAFPIIKQLLIRSLEEIYDNLVSQEVRI